MEKKNIPINFASETFWEFVQNIVLLSGFFLGWQLWRQHLHILAVGCAIASGIIGAWNIRVIERKFKGHDEPLKVTLTNSIAMPALMLIFIAYLSSKWSNWKTDLAVGMSAGISLATIQRLTIKAPLDLVRSAAFAIAFPVTLVGMRWLMTTLPVIVNILISTAVVTFLIVLIHRGSKKIPKPGGHKHGG